MIKAVIAGLLMISLLGCHRPSNKQFVPAPSLAREALAASLDAWMRGESTVQLQSASPSVHLIDGQQRENLQLESYEIVGELPVDGGRRFEVTLRLREPAKEETTQYVVIGIDPLWVFRQQDYDLLAHWDHAMPQEPAAPDDSESAQEEASAGAAIDE